MILITESRRDALEVDVRLDVEGQYMPVWLANAGPAKIMKPVRS